MASKKRFNGLEKGPHAMDDFEMLEPGMMVEVSVKGSHSGGSMAEDQVAPRRLRDRAVHEGSTARVQRAAHSACERVPDIRPRRWRAPCGSG